MCMRVYMCVSARMYEHSQVCMYVCIGMTMTTTSTHTYVLHPKHHTHSARISAGTKHLRAHACTDMNHMSPRQLAWWRPSHRARHPAASASRAVCLPPAPIDPWSRARLASRRPPMTATWSRPLLFQCGGPLCCMRVCVYIYVCVYVCMYVYI